MPGIVCLLGVGFLGIGLGTLIEGIQDVEPARQLLVSGRTARAQESLVYLRDGRGGRYVDGVRVRVDAWPVMIRLSDLAHSDPTSDESDESDDADYLDDLPRGWQPATERTGYVAPFEIRYLIRPDGVPVAMATADLAGRGTYRPIVEGAGWLAGAATVGVIALLQRRRERRADHEP